MTYQADCTLPEDLLDQIAESGLAALPDALRLLLNAAMLVERQKFLARISVGSSSGLSGERW